MIAIKKDKRGFTLAELLIVVAIIGVLVAVSIPIFTAQLEKAREATDIANMRAAKVSAVAAYLMNEFPNQEEAGTSVDLVSAWYDPTMGTFDPDADMVDFGKGTTANPTGRNENDMYRDTGFYYNCSDDMTQEKIHVSIRPKILNLGEIPDDSVEVTFVGEEFFVDYDLLYIDDSDGTGITTDTSEENYDEDHPEPANGGGSEGEG